MKFLREQINVDTSNVCGTWGCDKPQVKPYPACAEHLQHYLNHQDEWVQDQKATKIL